MRRDYGAETNPAFALFASWEFLTACKRNVMVILRRTCLL